MQVISLTRALSRRAVLSLIFFVPTSLVLGACDGDGEDPSSAAPTPSAVFTGGPGPYVSVAVDNHFHDVHPVDHKEIDDDEAFVVRNEGSNLHNVTFPGLGINEDIEPGESWRINPVRKLGGLGTYEFFCKYHAEEDMIGKFTVVEETS